MLTKWIGREVVSNVLIVVGVAGVQGCDGSISFRGCKLRIRPCNLLKLLKRPISNRYWHLDFQGEEAETYLLQVWCRVVTSLLYHMLYV